MIVGAQDPLLLGLVLTLRVAGLEAQLRERLLLHRLLLLEANVGLVLRLVRLVLLLDEAGLLVMEPVSLVSSLSVAATHHRALILSAELPIG